MSFAKKLQDLPEKRRKGDSVWLCSECGVKNSSAISQNCQNCGRDIAGNPGTRPDASVRRRI